MKEKTLKYKTPHEKTEALLETVETDLKENHPNTSWQDLTEIWRNIISQSKNIHLI
jgi:hypothetical protein